MDKKRLEIIITVVLAAVLIFSWIKTVAKIKERSSPVPQPVQAAVAPLISTGHSPAVIEEVKESSIRCPFSGKIYSGREEVVDLKLTGIVWDDKRPQALINDNVVQEGSSVGQFKVIKIYKDKVKLGSAIGDFEIKLKQ